MVSAAVAWIRAARPELTADQAAQVVRLGARDIGRPGLGALDRLRRAQPAGALAHQPPAADPLEPNDDLELGQRQRVRHPRDAIFTAGAKTVARRALDLAEDPVDVYRVKVPPGHRCTSG